MKMIYFAFKHICSGLYLENTNIVFLSASRNQMLMKREDLNSQNSIIDKCNKKISTTTGAKEIEWEDEVYKTNCKIWIYD